MTQVDFIEIVREAVHAYDDSKNIETITDISAKVSTNYVYRITFSDENMIIAKLSYFGKFEHFVEDHSIINSLANNLPAPFENVLSRSLMRGNSLFVHRHRDELIDAWVVFYRPIRTKKRMPKRLEEPQIGKLAKSVARFHKACDSVRNTLPDSSKTMEVDIRHLLSVLRTDAGRHDHRMHLGLIRDQCRTFLDNIETLNVGNLNITPVFVDWNIGNFSVTSDLELFSRWDYDWFRMSSRMMDFYFFSRVVSSVGDRTVFSYDIGPLMEERFILFLKEYHREYPLKKAEILLLKEVYRFFLLNYVIKYGQYFFHDIFANRLQQEAYNRHLPSIDEKFDPAPLLKALNL
jgi:hypothetical protein